MSSYFSKRQVEAAAEAIANARGNRRGMPAIRNLLAALPDDLRTELLDDAQSALDAALLVSSTPEDVKRAAEEQGLGATGDYPMGKLVPSDMGELRAAVAADRARDRVLINFGKPVAWLSMDAAQATAFAEAVLSKARALR